MEVNVTIQGRYHIARVKAVRIDTQLGTYLNDQLEKILQTDSPHLILDFTGAYEIESSAMGYVLLILRKVQQKQGNLRIVADDSHLLELFSFANLDQLIEIVPTLKQALKDGS